MNLVGAPWDYVELFDWSVRGSYFLPMSLFFVKLLKKKFSSGRSVLLPVKAQAELHPLQSLLL